MRKGEQMDINSREQSFGILKENLFLAVGIRMGIKLLLCMCVYYIIDLNCIYIYIFFPLVAQIFHLNPDPMGFLGTRLYYLYVVHMPTCCLLRVKMIGSRESEVSEVTPVTTTSCSASTRMFKLETNQLFCPRAGITPGA